MPDEISTREAVIPYEKLIVLAIIFLAFVFATIALNKTLAIWQYGIVALIFLAIAVWQIYNKKQSVTDWKTKIFGAGGSIITGIIVLVIILAVLWPFIGPADKIYSSEEFSKFGCSQAVLSSSGCTLSGTEKMSIAKIVVVPESLPTGGKIDISIGPYRFEYSSYSAKAEEDYYKGEVYQNGWGKITYAPVKHGKPNDLSVPIMVTTNYWWLYQGYPSLWIKSRLVYENLADGELLDNDPPVQGLVTIRSEQSIKEVEIYYGSLPRTILGVIGMS